MPDVTLTECGSVLLYAHSYRLWFFKYVQPPPKFSGNAVAKTSILLTVKDEGQSQKPYENQDK